MNTPSTPKVKAHYLSLAIKDKLDPKLSVAGLAKPYKLGHHPPPFSRNMQRQGTTKIQTKTTANGDPKQ